MAGKFEITGKKEAMYLFSHALREKLEKDGFDQNVHLAEPIHESTVFEYSKGEKKLVLAIDEDSLGGARLGLSSDEVDIGLLVRTAVSEVFGDCIHTFLKPLTNREEREKIIEKIDKIIGKKLDER